MKIIGMLPTYNDEDIIEEVIQHLISQEIPLVVLDNGSTDDTYKICEKYVDKGILKLEQFKSESYHWDTILRMLYDMALLQSPDWVIRSDSDEFLESGIKGVTLKETITQADKENYNLIQFDWFDFYMTDDDVQTAKSIKEKFPYYTFVGDFNYRTWKVFPGIRIGDASGHYPIFPYGKKYKISPRKNILRHYPLRSKQHTIRKMKERTRGKTINEEESGTDAHIRSVLKQDFSQGINHKLLSKYEEDGKWDYKIKLTLYSGKHIPEKKEIFTDEGNLRKRPKTPLEYRLALIEKEEQLSKLRKKLGIGYRAKRVGLNKVRKILGKNEHDI